MKLDIIPTSDIYIGDRFRKDMGDIQELKRSIKEKGLIHPIAVGIMRDDIADNLYVLIAGGRRLMAYLELNLETIPVRIYERTLTPSQMRSIELEENIKRKDMSWIEEVRIQKEIHDLQVMEKGVKISTSPDAPGHSLRDTARLVDRSPASVSIDIKLAEMMSELPGLNWADCKDKTEAKKMVKKIEQKITTGELLVRATEALGRNVDKRKQRLVDSFVVGDFFEEVKKVESRTVNLVEIDPPYAIELEKQKKDYNYEGYNEINIDVYESFMRDVLMESYRVMTDNSWLILWFGPEPWFEMMYKLLIETGFRTRRLCGIWDKSYSQTQTNTPAYYLGNAYEMFFYARKGNVQINKQGRSNVFSYAPVNPQDKIHPTERPIELIAEILNTFGRPNDHVMVPFAGSGNTIIAANILNMIGFGYDLTQDYKDKYLIRVEESL